MPNIFENKTLSFNTITVGMDDGNYGLPNEEKIEYVKFSKLDKNL